MKFNKNLLFLIGVSLCCNSMVFAMGDPLYDSEAADAQEKSLALIRAKIDFDDMKKECKKGLDEFNAYLRQAEDAQRVILSTDESMINNKAELLRDIREKISKLRVSIEKIENKMKEARRKFVKEKGNELLFRAISSVFSDDIRTIMSEIQQLVQEDGIDLGVTDSDGNTPLLEAASGDSVVSEKIALYLLKHCSKEVINKPSRNNNTALLVACDNGYLDLIKLMLPSCTEKTINLANSNGWTPLAMASDSGHTDVVKELLKREDLKIDKKAVEVAGQEIKSLLNQAREKRRQAGSMLQGSTSGRSRVIINGVDLTDMFPDGRVSDIKMSGDKVFIGGRDMTEEFNRRKAMLPKDSKLNYDFLNL